MSGNVGVVPNSDALRQLAIEARQQLGAEAGVAVIAADISGKPAIIVAANEQAVSLGIHAGKLVKSASAVLGGGGGGRPELAQGGGTDSSRIPEALRSVLQGLG